jgi:two-component system sensor histidine kinase/response regulator
MSGENPAPSVLVVDDTLENLRLLSHMLGEKGYDVRAVTNGRQALRAVEDDPPDLILLDAMMPEMNGFEVCRQLKSHSWGRDVPIMFLTALNDTTDKVLTAISNCAISKNCVMTWYTWWCTTWVRR